MLHNFLIIVALT